MSPVKLSNNIEIREIDTSNARDLYEVASLRYQVTVQEMGLSMRHANHHSGVVIESLDYSGHVFAAFSEGEIVGTMRQNLLKEAGVDEYFNAYAVSQLPAMSLNQISVTTRLVIKKEFRRSRVSLELPVYAYNFLLNNGITYDVIDSRPHLLPFFKKLGYRPHLQSWGHPEFGDVVVQYLAIRDKEHLESTGSPFLKHLKKNLH